MVQIMACITFLCFQQYSLLKQTLRVLNGLTYDSFGDTTVYENNKKIIKLVQCTELKQHYITKYGTQCLELNQLKFVNEVYIT